MTGHSPLRVIFLDDRDQARWVAEKVDFNSQTQLIALTAGAMQGLDELGLEYKPVSEVVNTYALASAERQSSLDCFNLLSSLEAWILERYTPAAQIGPGFLTGMAYHLQLSIGGVATRTYLMREASRALSPSSVTLFQGEINKWFLGDGYQRDPWIEFLAVESKESNREVQVIDMPRPPFRKKIEGGSLYNSARSRLYNQAKKVVGLLNGTRLKTKHNPGVIRLVIADAEQYEWRPVLDGLRKNGKFYPIFLKSAFLTSRSWLTHYYQDTIFRGFRSRGESLNCETIRFDPGERENLSSLLDQWMAENPGKGYISVLGMDLFSAMLPHLRSLLTLSIPLARYSKEMAVRVLERTKPHMICFNSLTRLSSKILAEQARLYGIPVIAYQHGGSYGVQDVPTHDFAEFAHADYFLSYGCGMIPPTKPIITTRAQFIPVGSAVIERSMKKRMAHKNNKNPVRVLWIGEVSESNVVGGAWLVEDTTRYLLEVACLEILNKAGIWTTYRPFPGNPEALAIPEWINKAGLSFVHLDASRSLAKSIQECDLVICDSSSSTTWFETIALGIPLIVYCDPQQTHLTDQFAKDLDRACHWCKSVPDLLNSLERLVREKQVFVNELSRLSTGEFKRKYILHERESVKHVLSFLSAICSEGVDCD